MPSVVITTTGSGYWTVPAGVTSVDVECWGGGGAGPFGAAGGGGAWSKTTIAVAPGQALTYYVAPAQPYSGSGSKTTGYDTWFGSPTTVLAKGADGHLGGQASAGYGAQKFSGGSARFVDPSTGQPGPIYDATYGGSGASASPAGDGGDGLYNPQTVAGSGGVSPGAGAAGQSNVEGGGGAGGAEQGGSPGGGSRAATSTRGQIRISYEVGSAPPADTTPPTITSAAAQSVNENAAFSLALTASEAVTWTKVGGADQALFTLSGSTLSMTAKDFEAPTDANGDNVYVVTIRATDAASNFSERTFNVTVLNVSDTDTTAPTITSSASPSVVENTANPSGTLTASEAVTWTKVGGADQALFSLSGSTWTLNATPDFEQKSSYTVIWRATDAAGNWSDQTMTLAVTDVDETPAVGEEVTEQFKTPGAISWTVPAGVTSVTAQVWGPGGAGADGTSSRAGGGGGGGGFRQATAYPVTPGQTISLRVGAQGTSSFFVSTSICQANAGGASTGQGPGAAGTHSGSAAGFGFNGGAGNWGGAGATANGGSAGSSASPTSNGAPNGLGDGELRGAGGAYGNYGTLSPAGPGQQPGGGGGGGYSNSPGGAGGAGQIYLTYTRAANPTRRAPRFFHWL